MLGTLISITNTANRYVQHKNLTIVDSGFEHNPA